MASLFVEIPKGADASSVTADLEAQNITFVKRYDNISSFLNTGILLYEAEVGTPILPLLAIPGVQYAEPDEEHIYVPSHGLTTSFPGVPEFPLGEGLSLGPPASLGQSALPEIGELIDLPAALMKTKGGEGVVIVIVDSGVDGQRVPANQRAGGWTDDLSGDPWSDTFGHGTMVALIALHVAPNAKIFSARMAPGPNGGIMKESVLSALDALIAIKGENPDLKIIVNNSWATSGCLSELYW